MKRLNDLLRRSGKGFTLVELTVVFAIGGLFVVLVLLGLSGAQKDRRDAQRKTYLLQVAQNIDKFKGDAANGFQYPTNVPATPGYFITNFDITTGGAYSIPAKDPLSNSSYTFQVVSLPAVPTSSTAAGVLYVPYNPCGVISGTSSGPTAGMYSLYIGLEGAPYYCVDNH